MSAVSASSVFSVVKRRLPRRIIAPLRTVEPAAALRSQNPPAGFVGVYRPEAFPVHCPRCDKAVAPDAVVTEAVEQDPNTLEHFRPRKFFCDHCDVVIYWHQPCTAGGLLLNMLISDHAELKDPRYIDKFLKRHPEARGVEQA